MSRCSTAIIILLLWILVTAGCESPEHSAARRSSGVPDQGLGYHEVSEDLYCRSLAKPKLSRGPRFSSLEDCGVAFENYMRRDRTNMLLETGSGVALGDYDGDGLIDIYLTGSDISNKLYRNLGELRFEDVTDLANVDGTISESTLWASGASFADIDNDGDLDLHVCNMAAPDLLYVNQGDGTFIEDGFSRGVAYNGASKQANYCDYDRDGDLDIYLVTYQDIVEIPHELIREKNGKPEVIPGKEEYAAIIDGHVEYWVGEQDLLYRNDGSGHFEEVARESGIAGYACGLGSVWFDFDNDGWQDIYVTSDFKQPDRLYRNNRDGSFTDVLPNTVRRTPWYSMGIDAGDLNNDGLLDVLIADMADRTHFGQKLNMGDMSESGWFLTYGKPRQFMTNCLFLNAGNNQFLEFARQAGLAKSNWTWSVRFADLDLDGNQDVFFTNGHARDNMNSDLVLKLKEFKKKKGDTKLTYAERNKFGIQVPKREETNLAFANRGELKFESVGEAWGLDYKGVSHAAGFADLDLDGDLDCVINNYYSPSIVYENTTSSGGRLLVELRSSRGNFFGVGSKVEIWQGENYQRRDLLPGRGYLTSDPMMVHFGVDGSHVIDRLKVTWPDARVQEFRDIKPDFLYRVIDSPDLKPSVFPAETAAVFVDQTVAMNLDFTHRESTYDDFERESLLPFQLSRLGGSVACGDINDDGFVDLFCGGPAGQAGCLFLGRDGKGFELIHGPWEQHADREDMGVVFFDADGDGREDLYVASGSNEFEAESVLYRDRLYRNLGGEAFEDSTDISLPKIFNSSSSVAAADFDRDGDLDLFVGSRSIPGKYPLTPKSYLLLNERGVFRPALKDVSGDIENVGLVSSAIWSDFNGDGWSDLLIATEWGPVSVFENQQGKLVNVTQSAGLSNHQGWWHGIAAGDLDADGDIDYVVTNQGRNTKYHASESRPHRLYYDDFDENGSLDLVEAEYEGDVEYPVRGRSCSSRCMPFISEKFKTFEDYSLATISDIYETKEKPRPYKELRYLESAIIWNEGDAGFRLEALPDLSQNAPAYGVAISDFDHDGYSDILLATNFFAAQPETGYMDGGLGWMLKGTAAGRFEPVWPNASGIVVPSDGNGLIIADFDNDNDLDAVFAVNNDSFRLFKNETSSAGVTLVLEGPEGNQNAVGARIILHGKTDQAFEVSAGGSYLSQSSSRIVVARQQLEASEKIEVFWPDGTSSQHSLQSVFDPSTNRVKITYKKPN